MGVVRAAYTDRNGNRLGQFTGFRLMPDFFPQPSQCGSLKGTFEAKLTTWCSASRAVVLISARLTSAQLAFGASGVRRMEFRSSG